MSVWYVACDTHKCECVSGFQKHTMPTFDPGHLAAVSQVDFVPKHDQPIITAMAQLQNKNWKLMV